MSGDDELSFVARAQAASAQSNAIVAVLGEVATDAVSALINLAHSAQERGQSALADEAIEHAERCREKAEGLVELVTPPAEPG